MIKLSIDHDGKLDCRSRTIGSLISMIKLSVDNNGQLDHRSRITGSHCTWFRRIKEVELCADWSDCFGLPLWQWRSALTESHRYKNTTAFRRCRAPLWQFCSASMESRRYDDTTNFHRCGAAFEPLCLNEFLPRNLKQILLRWGAWLIHLHVKIYILSYGSGWLFAPLRSNELLHWA